MTKSTWSNRSAMPSFVAVRAASPRATMSRFTISSAIDRPKAISVVRSSLQSGQRSPSSIFRPARLASAQVTSSEGSFTSRSTTSRPASRASASAPATTRSCTSRRTTAPPKVGAIATFLPAQVVRAEVTLPAVDAGEAVGIAAVVTVGHVVPAAHVADRPGHAADHDGHRMDERHRASRDAAGRALHPDEPVEAGGDADRPAAVASAGDRHEPTGDRRRRAARGPARRLPVLPRVVAHAVEAVDADVQTAELAGQRQADRRRRHRRRAGAGPSCWCRSAIWSA